MIGTLLANRYRIDGPLGEGGMGIVYRAHDTLLDRPVAIKSLASHFTTPDGLKRLLREAQAAAKLTHPGIVATYDVLENGDGRFIVMELVEGKTLREVIPLPWREATDLMRGVFEAIGFAHGRGIIHRDLKPENIIVTSNGSPKVMDFGLARSEGGSRMTQTGMVVGTATYMAPEQALRGKAVPQSDLYALGCVFYEVLTGAPPFSGEDPLAIITQHINLPPRTPRQAVPDLPPAIEALILKLLAKDPSERLRSAADVVKLLDLTQSVRAAEGRVGIEPSPTDRVRHSRLVGRQDVMGRLLEHLDRAMAGAGGVVMISGEPGIGKTRTIDELVAGARLRGFQVLIARCHERDTTIPYLAISEALEGFARRLSPEKWENLLAAGGDEILLLVSDMPLKHLPASAVTSRVVSAGAYGGAEQPRALPTRGLRNLLTHATQDAPVLLVVDDLHWADPSSLELLHDIAVYTREIPLLIVGAYREVELERAHPLNRLLVELNRQRVVTRERLRRFAAPDTHALLSALLGGDAPGDLAALIQEETEGNPFFIEEIVNGLIEEERLLWNEHDAVYRLAPGVTTARLAAEIPQGIKAAIGARLDHLSEEAQHVLSLAAVIGRRFSSDLLVRLASNHGLTEEDVERALHEARAARFIGTIEQREGLEAVKGYSAGSLEGEADLTFDHPLLHQVAYGELDRRRRRRLHAEVGYLLEDMNRGRESLHSERLAYHFLESDDDPKAIHYAIRAGDKILLAFYDQDLALGFYLAALETALAREPRLRHLSTRAPVAVHRGALHRFTSEEREAVIAYLAEVLATVRGTDAAKAVADLAGRICLSAFHMGEVYQASLRLHEETLLGPDVEKFVAETERGKLVGVLEFPGPGGPYPVVLLFHGSGGTKEGMFEQARRYLQRGMAALSVDLPGFGETTVMATATREDALVLQEMITAVLSHDRVDRRGVGIAGWSLGPWHGTMLAAHDDRVRAVVSISGVFNPGDPRPANLGIPEEVWLANLHARWKAGKRPTPEPMEWGPDTNVFDVAHQIKCPVLVAYGALEPERFRAQGEEFARAVPTAVARPWRSGVHVLANVPEAYEDAAEWMRQQLIRG
jgi:dienelactone hydrolase